MAINSAQVYCISKRKSIFIFYSAKSEYVALLQWENQILNIHRLFVEFLNNTIIDFEPNIAAASLHIDNFPSLSNVKKLKPSEINKHIDLKAHHIKNIQNKDVINIQNTSTLLQDNHTISSSNITHPICMPSFTEFDGLLTSS